jgi:hypothetical protein
MYIHIYIYIISFYIGGFIRLESNDSFDIHEKKRKDSANSFNTNKEKKIRPLLSKSFSVNSSRRDSKTMSGRMLSKDDSRRGIYIYESVYKLIFICVYKHL